MRAWATAPRVFPSVPVEVISKRVGHASPSITSDIYSHVAEDPALRREAAERVAALLRPR